jgi:hypothetical protein
VSDQLETDLASMVGVWHDRLQAYDLHGDAVSDDPHGGTPGPFPYDNLVYCDFDGEVWTQTNVTFRGRDVGSRTFQADVADGILRFRRLGPDAPPHIGVSGGPGLIWFVAESLDHPGLQQYNEPDLIRLDVSSDPARRWRYTALYRHGPLVRPMLVEGERLTTDTTGPHDLDPRGAEALVHGEKSTTAQYKRDNQPRKNQQGPPT